MLIGMFGDERIESQSTLCGVLKAIGKLGGKDTIPILMGIRSRQRIDKNARSWMDCIDISFDEAEVRNLIDRTIIILNNVPTTSSSEASSSHNAHESRSPERRGGRGR